MYYSNGYVYGSTPNEMQKVVSVRVVGDKMLLLKYSSEEERLFDASILQGEVFEPLDDIRNIRFIHRRALIIQTETVCGHIVEPDLIRASVSGLGKDQNGSGNAGIGFEHAGRHGNDGFQAVILHNLFPDVLVRFRRAEENAVRDDARAASTDFQHAQKKCQKQKLRLLGLADAEKIR